MAQDKGQVAWNLFTEVRKDILEYQKMRTQVIGFKITVVGTGLGLILANLDKIPAVTLLVPAFAAIFFDFLVSSYSFAIKRTGAYCCAYVEPIIKESCEWPGRSPFWEEFMRRPTSQRNFALLGNLGITALAIAPACYYIFSQTYPVAPWVAGVALLLLLFFFFFDIWAYLVARRFKDACPESNAAAADSNPPLLSERQTKPEPGGRF